MPRLDKTGPAGKGPGTGRGLGPCVSEKGGGYGSSGAGKGGIKKNRG